MKNKYEIQYDKANDRYRAVFGGIPLGFPVNTMEEAEAQCRKQQTTKEPSWVTIHEVK